jgi:NAD(P)-dependent dehydrogenase (short-subunit alcohol dehydrogenase family)
VREGSPIANLDTVVVTGASRGIGLELVRQFLQSGQSVVAACRKPENAAELRALACTRLSLLRLDVSEEASVSEFVKELGAEPVDVLVNNAGVWGGAHQDLGQMDYAGWREAFEVNTLGPYRVSTALVGHLSRSSNPRIVTLSSQMGALSRQSTGSYAYRSSKAAVNKVMQVLALELRAKGIIVCPVHPGWVRTEMGGSEADLSVEESAAGLLNLIDRLTLDHSGRLWTWESAEHPW